MATIKLGYIGTGTPSTTSTSGVCYCCTGAGPGGGTLVAPSDGNCSKINIYVVTAGTFTINLAIYDNNGSPNYNRLAYQSYNQAWSSGWNQVTLSSPISITSGNTYHPAVAYPSTTTVPYVDTGASYRHSGTLDNPWTDSTTRTYTPCVNLEYDTAPYSLTYDVGTAAFRIGCEIFNNYPTCSGNPTSYSINNALPSGLSFNTTTGVISGTPSGSTQSATNYTVTATNTYGNTTKVISVEIAAQPTTVTVNVYGTPYSGGDYSTLQAAYNAVTEKDLVTNNLIQVFNCRGAVGSLVKVPEDTWTTGIYNWIEIHALGSYKHTGKFDGCTAYDTHRSILWDNTSNLKIIGMTLAGQDENSGIVIHGDTTRVCIYDCYVTNQNPATGCIVIDSSGYAGNGRRHYIRNCMLAGNNGIRGLRVSGSSDQSAGNTKVYVYNTTVINNLKEGMLASAAGQIIAKNCYSGNNNLDSSGVKDYDYQVATGATVTMTTCHSSDTSGNTQTSVANCHFTNSTAGSEDLHIDATSALYQVGTDLRSDTILFVADDIEDSTRAATPCVGADEYVSTGLSETATIDGSADFTETQKLYYKPTVNIDSYAEETQIQKLYYKPTLNIDSIGDALSTQSLLLKISEIIDNSSDVLQNQSLILKITSEINALADFVAQHGDVVNDSENIDLITSLLAAQSLINKQTGVIDANGSVTISGITILCTAVIDIATSMIGQNSSAIDYYNLTAIIRNLSSLSSDIENTSTLTGNISRTEYN